MRNYVLIALLFCSNCFAINYLANEVGCKKWKEKRIVNFSSQAGLAEFIEKSRLFFDKINTQTSKEKLEESFSNLFSELNKENPGNYKYKFSYDIVGSKVRTIKKITHPSGAITIENSGIESLFETKNKTKELGFVMAYDFSKSKIETVIEQGFYDGSKVSIPVEDYVVLKMSKSCKRHYQVSETNYFKKRDIITTRAQRLPAKVKKITTPISF